MRFRFAGFNLTVTNGPLTGNRALTFPDKSGTVALVSDIQSGSQSGSLSGTKAQVDEVFWQGNCAPGTSGGEVTLTTSGGTSGYVAIAESARPGIFQIATGTTATGRNFIGSTSTAIHAAGDGRLIYSIDAKLTQLSIAAQRFQVVHGFVNSLSAASTNGAYFLYDEGGISGGGVTANPNWQAVVCNNGSRTFWDTGVLANTNWINFRVEIDPTGSEVSFYINNTIVVSTSGPTVPVGVARPFFWGSQIFKSVGTTACNLQIDWIYFRREYQSSRPVPGLISTSIPVYLPGSVQELIASSTILANSPIVQISSTADLLLNAFMPISSGLEGQNLRLWNSGNFAITLPTAGSSLQSSLQIPPKGFADFVYLSGLWRSQREKKFSPVFTPVIPLDAETIFANTIQTGAITLELTSGDRRPGTRTTYYITANGSAFGFLSAQSTLFRELADSQGWDARTGVVNRIEIEWDGAIAWYRINQQRSVMPSLISVSMSFPTRSAGISQSGNTYSSTVATAWAAQMTSAQTIPAGKSGRITAIVDSFCLIGLNDSSAAQAYPNYEYQAWVESNGTVSTNTSGGSSANDGVTGANQNIWLRITRATNGTVTVERSTNGTTWSTVRVFGGTNTGALYVSVDISGAFDSVARQFDFVSFEIEP